MAYKNRLLLTMAAAVLAAGITATAFAALLQAKGLHFEHLPLTAEELADQLVAKEATANDE